ncbi:MAG: TolC family protein [Gemmatimonadetes bacterium]|nr:TolC family protein [Gemmatimonadota bacterium]MYD27286.1 TolC family protein [Gemmatimonadota bacterium]
MFRVSSVFDVRTVRRITRIAATARQEVFLRSAMAMLVFVFVSAALVSSCASAPKPQRPSLDTPVPLQWTAAPSEGGTIDERWWSDFSDARLDGIIDEALTRNFELKSVTGRMQAARAQARIVGAPLLPQVSLDFNRTRTRRNFIGFPIPGGNGGVLKTTSTNYGVSTNINWEIDLWGRLSDDKAAALADLQGSQADLYGVRSSVAGQTAKAWFAAIEARRQLDLARATRDNFSVVNERIENRYARGLRPALDLRLSLANVAAAEAVVLQRMQAFDGVVRQLEILLGRYPSAELAIASELPPVPSTVPAGLPADLIARRPDLMLAERQLAAAGARIGVAKKARYPAIRLTGSGGTSTAALTDLLDGDFIVWSLVSSLLQPLFQGGRLSAGVDLAEANRDQVLANFADRALRAYGEVETALAADGLLRRREAALLEATTQAAAARELAESRYHGGLSDVITMLDAQRRAFDSEGQYLAVRRQRLDARVDLYLALGGGFERMATETADIKEIGDLQE